MKNSIQYRSEAPVKIRQTCYCPPCFTADVQAGRRTTIHGYGKTARAAYKDGISAYRKQLLQGKIVPAIIDEEGNAL